MEFWLDKCFGLSIAFPLDSLSKSWICPRETADKCGISKVDDRGTSATKRKLFSSGKCRGFPGEGQPFDFAQRAASLVVEFCWLWKGCFLSEKCPSRFVFEILHLPGELPA